ncbi:Ig-like domain-containing protein, partial [Tamlana sp. 62-3]
MKNNYYCVSLLKSFKVFSFLAFAVLINGLHAQAPSIQTGVTFQWSDTQVNNLNPATIESVTINGTLYNTFVVPTTYDIAIGTSNHNVNQLIENGVTKPINSSLPGWDALALDAFQDKNLNHYFAANPNGANICGDYTAALNTTVQRQTLSYGVPIPSNDGGVLAVTERGGNNCFYVEVYGTPVGGGPEQKLGQTFVVNNGNHYGRVFLPPVAGSDYWRSGRANNNGQTIAIALFYLNDLAPTGSSITRIEFIGATNDHGDGKFFLLQKYAVDQQVIECLDETYNGDLNVLNNEPANSTYTLISGPSNAGQSFTLNSDGTYTYEPTPGFIGDVTFTYELCLPAPNTSVCDTGSVTLSYVDLPPEPTYEIDCSGGDDNFTLTVTSPLNSSTDPNQYEYSVDGINFQTSPVFSGLTEGTYTVTVKSTYTTCIRTAASNAELINDSEAPTGTAPTGETGINLCSSDAQTSYSFNSATVATNYSDNCSTSLTVNLTDTLLSGNNCGWTLTYTYEVVDSSGNKIEDQTIIYSGSDQTSPTGSAPSGQTGINSCSADAETNAPFNATTIASNYSDNCTNVSVSLTNTEITGDDCSWTLTYTYDVLDECGNKLEDETITHSGGNQTPLSFITEASNLTVECDGDNSADLINWVTNYGGATVANSCTTITWSDNFSDLDIDCGNAGSGEVTFTATDACGNSVSTTATFTVEDTTAPTIDTIASDLTVECDGSGNTTELNNWLNSNGGAAASDACSANITWSNDYNAISDECGQTGTA